MGTSYFLIFLEARIQNESHQAKIQVLAGLHSFQSLSGRIRFLPCFTVPSIAKVSQRQPRSAKVVGISLLLHHSDPTLLPSASSHDYIEPTWIIQAHLLILKSAVWQP